MKRIVFLILTLALISVSYLQAQTDLSQPRFIFGKPFVESFQSMYKHNNIDMMITFTSAKSLKKFGEPARIEKYLTKTIF